MKDLQEIFKILYDASLEFVVIGGAAMHLQGSAYATKDVDFCYAAGRKRSEKILKKSYKT